MGISINQFAANSVRWYERIDFGKYKMQTDRRILYQFPKSTKVYDTDLNSWHSGDGVSFGGVEDISSTNNPTKYFDTLDEAANSADVQVGDVVVLKERTAGNGGGATWDVVLKSGATVNGFDVVACVGVDSLALVLRVSPGVYYLDQMGAASDAFYSGSGLYYSDSAKSVRATNNAGVLNYVFGKVVDGDRVVGLGPKYMVGAPITAVLPSGVSLSLGGFVFETGDFGFDIHANKGKIEILSVQGQGWESGCFAGAGVVLRSCVSLSFYIGFIRGYTEGVRVVGDKSTGGGGSFSCDIVVDRIYVDFTVGVCCLVTSEADEAGNGGWINENTYCLRDMAGAYGVKLVKGENQSDVFNGHKFNYCQFENIKLGSIYFEYAWLNVVEHPRMEGGHVPSDYLIKESQVEGLESYQNSFLLGSTLLWESKIDISCDSTVVGNVLSTNKDVLYSMQLGGNRSESGVRIGAKRSYNADQVGSVFFEGRDHEFGERYLCEVITEDGVKSGGLLNPYGEYIVPSLASGDVVVPSGTNSIEVSIDNPIVLIMPKNREILGWSCFLNVSYYGDVISVVKQSDLSVSIPNTSIVSAGVYLLLYKQNKWVVTRIGDKF